MKTTIARWAVVAAVASGALFPLVASAHGGDSATVSTDFAPEVVYRGYAGFLDQINRADFQALSRAYHGQFPPTPQSDPTDD